jgi:hypothetical protein
MQVHKTVHKMIFHPVQNEIVAQRAPYSTGTCIRQSAKIVRQEARYQQDCVVVHET